MYKVFFKGRRLILGLKEEMSHNSNDIYENLSKASLSDILVGFLNNEKPDELCLVSEDVEQLYSYFSSNFKVLYAAGGVVLNSKNEILGIYRLGKWDLPKGKQEKGESIEETAIREVKEECGIQNLRIESKLICTYHIYNLGKDYILKETHWYKMRCSESEQLQPQKEEAIEKLEWFSQNQLSEFRENTYENIHLVLNNMD